jgi:hypothetical protein
MCQPNGGGIKHSELPPERIREQKELLKSSFATPQYESEDWADLISTRTDPNAFKFACFVTLQSASNNYANLSLKNLVQQDPHSSPLFRLLHMHYQTSGETPKICQVALAKKNETPHFKNCLSQ